MIALLQTPTSAVLEPFVIVAFAWTTRVVQSGHYKTQRYED
jgi:hypothetical protein